MIETQFQKLNNEGRIWFGNDGNGQPNVIRYLSEIEGFVPWTWWPHEEVGHTDEAKKEIHEHFGKTDAFDTPKPVRLIKRMLQIGTPVDQEALVLDFFAGSGTTAQAVLELNREDAGNRRFILVQLPEPTGNKRFPTIAEIAKERVRRVIANLKSETGNILRGGANVEAKEDLGFKVFKLAESHYANWSGIEDRTAAAYQRQLQFVIESPLRDGWTPDGLLWEVAIKEGFGLNSVITSLDGLSVKAYRVSDPEKGQQFVACFADRLPADITKQLGLSADDLFVVLDAALDDTLASNLALQCRLKTI